MISCCRILPLQRQPARAKGERSPISEVGVVVILVYESLVVMAM